VKYPFLRSARERLNSIPLDDEVIDLIREPITDQAKYRLTLAIKHAKSDMQNIRQFRYDSYDKRVEEPGPPSDVVEFYSYFTAVLAAKNESYLTLALARTEATRAKTLFLDEKPTEMVGILREAVNLELDLDLDKRFCTSPVMSYLRVATQYELVKDARWQLVNMPLGKGLVYFSINRLQDLFAALVHGLMISGIRALRTAPVPRFVASLVEDMKPLVPLPPPRKQGQYLYIQKLLEHPIKDGRHRVIWLILAPYFTNVKGMDEASATDAILAYIGDSKYKQFIKSNVRRAIKSRLLPPSEQTIRSRHPDILHVLPKEVTRK